jgi:hypothetical protein
MPPRDAGPCGVDILAVSAFLPAYRDFKLGPLSTAVLRAHQCGSGSLKGRATK